MDRMVSYAEVMETTKLSRPTIQRRILDGTFPAGVVIGRRRYWPESILKDYMAELVESCRIADKKRRKGK